MESNEESMMNSAAENMDVDDRKEDDLLQSVSMDDVGGEGSVSSSILNSDDEDDGVNVTIQEIRNQMQVNDQNQNQERQILRAKLSGAKKKRFKKLLLSGHGREEALSMVLVPPKESTPKRPRNINNSSNSDSKPIPKKQKGQSIHISVNSRMENIRQDQPTALENQQSTYSEVAKWVRVGILPKNYPQIQLTDEQLYSLQEAILLKVTLQRRESFKPKFTNCWQRTGHLVINCQDRETSDWLNSVVPTLIPWKGAELTVVNADDIPRLDVMVGFFPQSVNDENDTIRVFIESQNDGLSTDRWKIIQRNILYENHVEWFFTVDEASMQHFITWNFLINYKFGQTKLRKKGMYKPGVDGMVISRDEPKELEPVSSVDPGTEQSLSVPVTSGTDGKVPEAKSSKNHHQSTQSTGLPKNENSQGKFDDRIYSGPSKNSNHFGLQVDVQCPGLAKDQQCSTILMDQKSSERSKDRNTFGLPKDQSGYQKDQNYSGRLKDQNAAGPSKDRNCSGSQRDRNTSGLPKARSRSGHTKDRNSSEPSKEQMPSGPEKDQHSRKYK